MLSICFSLSFGSIIANATEYSSERLFDQADLLTDEEEAKIQEQINKLQKKGVYDVPVYSHVVHIGVENCPLRIRCIT